jgi:hypothetical protein
MLIKGFLECLWVIKGILITEGNADNQEEKKESNFTLLEGCIGEIVC